MGFSRRCFGYGLFHGFLYFSFTHISFATYLMPWNEADTKSTEFVAWDGFIVLSQLNKTCMESTMLGHGFPGTNITTLFPLAQTEF
jgi:hypothetical protein